MILLLSFVVAVAVALLTDFIEIATVHTASQEIASLTHILSRIHDCDLKEHKHFLGAQESRQRRRRRHAFHPPCCGVNEEEEEEKSQRARSFFVAFNYAELAIKQRIEGVIVKIDP